MLSDEAGRRSERVLDVIRRQVAVSGRVTRRDGEPVIGGEVSIEPVPVRGEPVVPTRPDGIYFFLDLPGGEYMVTARDLDHASTGHGRGIVSWDSEGNVRAAVVDIVVTPQGRVATPPGSEAVRARHKSGHGRGRRVRSV